MKTREVYIKVTKDGPYLVYGISEITQKTILIGDEDVSIEYGNGESIEIKSEPAVICRCGESKNAPFCDGSHSKTYFDGTESAEFKPLSIDANKYDGPNLILVDNEKFCAGARFCDAQGGIWDLLLKGDEESDKQVIKEANLCPAGRLLVFDKAGNWLEHEHPVEVSLLEDTGLKVSGPIWLRGFVRVESENGESYELRSRQTICRCGKSTNKPFCDSAHHHIGFNAKYLK